MYIITRSAIYKEDFAIEALELKSYAKINLGLYLIGARPDGYHDIATVFQQIDLADTLAFRKTAASIHLESRGIPVPVDGGNLICRAFELFRQKTGIRGGLSVQLEKMIPTGSGLGGGSSNAAATLQAANQLWETNLPPDRLAGMGAELGSDVPFFIYGGTAVGEGRGEILSPIRWNETYWIVLVCPGISISTAWAYRQVKLNLTKAGKMTNFRAILGNCTPRTLKGRFINEFEGVVFRKYPRLKEIKENMYARDAFYASLSGSGSSVYGLFENREGAEQAWSFFSKQTGLVAFLSRPIWIRTALNHAVELK